MLNTYYNNALQLFSEKDIEQLAKKFAKWVVSYRERNSVLNMMEVEQEDEDEIR